MGSVYCVTEVVQRERCVAVNVWHIVQIVECMGVCVMLDRQNVYFVMFVTLVCLCERERERERERES